MTKREFPPGATVACVAIVSVTSTTSAPTIDLAAGLADDNPSGHVHAL